MLFINPPMIHCPDITRAKREEPIPNSLLQCDLTQAGSEVIGKYPK
ncbi:MAG: hypothetical protein HND39_16160 [Ignavibacteriota bacterium]|jgi:hypothetical protein|nr:hypothetical protein [Ignavibacteriales bacterium]MCZ7612598.1 hypothetical protein [Ignavibacteriaceae bacterium]NUM62379.1 hypothetical protein [Ignavibacteriaceae bacterium]QKJ97684.1 MAG: hypothetical protein HND39_16160 [Ignavibacteriota bacterium]